MIRRDRSTCQRKVYFSHRFLVFIVDLINWHKGVDMNIEGGLQYMSGWILCPPPPTNWGGAYSFTLVRTYLRPSFHPSVTLCSSVLVSTTPVFDAGIWNLHHSSDMHWTCAWRKQCFDSGHYCRIMSPWMTHIFWPYHTVGHTYFDHITL